MTFIKNIFIFGLLSVNSGSLLAEVSLPHTFQANTIAKAEQVNANFDALKDGINGLEQNISTLGISPIYRELTHTDAVGATSCDTNEILIGGGCACTGNRNDGTNYGILFSCVPNDNSYIGGCFPEDETYNSSLPDSPVLVRVVCLSTSLGKSSRTVKIPGAAEKQVNKLKSIREERIKQLQNQ